MTSIKNHKTLTTLVAIAALAGLLAVSTVAIGSMHNADTEVARVLVEKNMLCVWFDKNVHGSKKHKSWYLDLPTQLVLCRSCYRHFNWRKMVVPYLAGRFGERWMVERILTGN